MAGYKLTAVGAVPKSWQVDLLGSFVKRHNSGVYKRSDAYGRGSNILGVADIYGIDSIDGQQFDEVPLSSAERAKHTLEAGDLLYGESSLVREGIARTVYVTPRGAGTAFAWHTRRYSLAQDVLLPSYTYYFLQSRLARKHMMDHAIQTAITGINTAAYFSCPVLIPPLLEQHAIAAALSDVDALLTGLDRLIAKKRDLKRAAMRQLLTGQTRLPGFEGEWEVKRLGEVAEVRKGSGLSRSLLRPSGSRPCILYGELFTRYGRVIPEALGRTDSTEGLASVPGDVLMPGSTTTKGIDLAIASALLQEGVSLGGDILVIRRTAAAYDPIFLASYLTHARPNAISELTQGITIHHLYGKDLERLSIELPPLEEQVAIATILSDSDAELAALEARRDKTRLLKQGMMQELLTGRARLV